MTLGGRWSIDIYMNTSVAVDRLLRATPESMAIAPIETHSTILFPFCFVYTRVGFNIERRKHGS
jgi:hypothetical protein